MIFVFTIIAAVLLLSSSLLWLWLQAPQLAGLVSMLFELCRSVALLCVSATSLVMAALMWTAVASLGVGFLYATVRQVRAMLRSARALSILPVADGKKSIVLIKDDAIATAFTWGLLRPRIYLSTGLIKKLTRAELRAVVLHEAHHRRHRDPLRYFLAAFIKDMFFYLPIGVHLASRLRFLRERAADDSAVSRTQDPLNLAGAMVKVARLGAGALPGHREAAFFKGEPVEGRIRRLVEGAEEPHPSPPAWAVLSSSIAGLALVISLFVPIAAHGRYGQVFCSEGHCSTVAPGVAPGTGPGMGSEASAQSPASAGDGAMTGVTCKVHCESKL
ncbi:MAG: hypothetical protein BMS9Abin24_069 [Thermodesulfobacteriota bacterium]|nr:MAG: hypothetical protein BMS9Abin24_069 [Thermodesulfobacteriota bacterium]